MPIGRRRSSAVFGGPEVAWSHASFGAIITFSYFALHSVQPGRQFHGGGAALRNPQTKRFEIKLVWAALFGPDSMVPSLQDWRDFVAHQKWFFGKGPKPQFDRWTYWERFDYFAVFWGIFIIGTSGLVLWFPKFFTAFQFGWVINIAMVVHSGRGAARCRGLHFHLPFLQHASSASRSSRWTR